MENKYKYHLTGHQVAIHGGANNNTMCTYIT